MASVTTALGFSQHLTVFSLNYSKYLTMTLFIPYTQWFTIEQWLAQNYITEYSYVHIQDMRAITFKRLNDYAVFYSAWQHIICVDNLL